jgi:hypothetical protein
MALLVDRDVLKNLSDREGRGIVRFLKQAEFSHNIFLYPMELL